MQEKEVEATILFKLYRQKRVGGVHTAFDNLQKGFPKHLRGTIKDLAKDLIRKGLIISKPTSYGLQVSLNKEKLIEVVNFIELTLGIKLE